MEGKKEAQMTRGKWGCHEQKQGSQEDRLVMDVCGKRKTSNNMTIVVKFSQKNCHIFIYDTFPSQ